jgi:hypothetical protein
MEIFVLCIVVSMAANFWLASMSAQAKLKEHPYLDYSEEYLKALGLWFVKDIFAIAMFFIHPPWDGVLGLLMHL